MLGIIGVMITYPSDFALSRSVAYFAVASLAAESFETTSADNAGWALLPSRGRVRRSPSRHTSPSRRWHPRTLCLRPRFPFWISELLPSERAKPIFGADRARRLPESPILTLPNPQPWGGRDLASRFIGHRPHLASILPALPPSEVTRDPWNSTFNAGLKESRKDWFGVSPTGYAPPQRHHRV